MSFKYYRKKKIKLPSLEICISPLIRPVGTCHISKCDPVVLQCTCLAVSRKWLALGTSAGGLHLIQREGWKQRLILTHKVICDRVPIMQKYRVDYCSAVNCSAAYNKEYSVSTDFCSSFVNSQLIVSSFSGGIYRSGGVLSSWWRLYCCCNKVRVSPWSKEMFQTHLPSCKTQPLSSGATFLLFSHLLHTVSLCWSQCLSLFQSGSGGGVGAAAGAAGSSREGQCVLGAPRSGHHCALLGHQRTQSFCRGLRRQGVLSPCRILQAGQGND